MYEAYDRDRRERVALKTLNIAKPRSLRFLKREFRELAELRHNNLARLYELIEEDGQWFFTMELVQGVNWLEYVRHKKESVELEEEARTAPAGSDPRDAASFRRALRPRLPYNEGRLRSSLRQLVRGLNALHREGKLHCDVKPSNVLITEQGRVVLLDFGLVTARDSTQTSELATRTAVGTPAYMSPEQARGQPLTAASDLYSVGVFLYRGLTGTLPFPRLAEAHGQSEDTPRRQPSVSDESGRPPRPRQPLRRPPQPKSGSATDGEAGPRAALERQRRRRPHR